MSEEGCSPPQGISPAAGLLVAFLAQPQTSYTNHKVDHSITSVIDLPTRISACEDLPRQISSYEDLPTHKPAYEHPPTRIHPCDGTARATMVTYRTQPQGWLREACYINTSAASTAAVGATRTGNHHARSDQPSLRRFASFWCPLHHNSFPCWSSHAAGVIRARS